MTPADPQNPARGPVMEPVEAAPRPRRRGPLLITDDLEPLGQNPADAPPPDDLDHPHPTEGAAARAVRAAARRGSTLAALFWGAVVALAGLAISVAAFDLVAGLIARNPVIGGAATVLAGIVAAGLVVFALRELAGMARLSRVDSIRDGALHAVEHESLPEAQKALRSLRKLYSGRRDLDWALDRLRGREGDVMDAAGLIGEAEAVLMGALDPRAEAAVGKAARSVATVTALVPMTLIDVLSALTINLRMIRTIAEIYGGRAGWLGSWRLLKAVAGHLVATGAVAMVDDMIAPVVSGGLVARLSRRFGEGLVNGALTARVGAATIEVCRPLPFVARPKPSGRKLAAGALRGLAGKGDGAGSGLG